MATTTKRKVKRTSDVHVPTRASKRASTMLSSARTRASTRASTMLSSARTRASRRASTVLSSARTRANIKAVALAKTARQRVKAHSPVVDTEDAASQSSTVDEDMALDSDVVETEDAASQSLTADEDMALDNDVASVSDTMASIDLDCSDTDTLVPDSEDESGTTTAVPSTTSPDPPPTLMTIPDELRFQIFSYIVPSDKTYTLRPTPTLLPPPNPHKRDRTGVALPTHHTRPEILLTLMLVCHTFASEIMTIFLEQNTFCFGYKSTKGLEMIDEYGELACLRSVRLDINFSRQGEAWKSWMRLLTLCLAEMDGLERVVFAVYGFAVDEEADEGFWGVMRALRGKGVLEKNGGSGVTVDEGKGTPETREWFLKCLLGRED